MIFIKYNKIHYSPISSKKYDNIHIVVLIQILTLLIIIFFYFNLIKEQVSKKANNGFNKKKYEENSFVNYTLNNDLSKKIRMLKMLTNNDESEYKQILKCLINDPDDKLCIYHLISPKKVQGKDRILLGSKSDGCYVLLNDFNNIKIAYSFGIGRRIQFDKTLADKGIDVYMYDHTI